MAKPRNLLTWGQGVLIPGAAELSKNASPVRASVFWDAPAAGGVTHPLSGTLALTLTLGAGPVAERHLSGTLALTLTLGAGPVAERHLSGALALTLTPAGTPEVFAGSGGGPPPSRWQRVTNPWWRRLARRGW
jgi:hypothetical protein